MKRLLLLATCAVAFPAMAQNVASVNGEPITKAEVDQIMKQIPSDQLTAANAGGEDKTRQLITKELIQRKLLIQEALKQKLDQKEDVKFTIDNAKSEILINALLQEWYKNDKVSEADMKKVYDETMANLGSEYDVQHILVKTEKEADALLAQIKSKKLTFEKAAKKSLDTGSAQKGGKLGWASADNYVPPFRDAVKKAKKGELVSQPVKSEFGWHIIKVLDSRPVKGPTFEQAKSQLEGVVKKMHAQEKIKALESSAKIENIDANTKK